MTTLRLNGQLEGLCVLTKYSFVTVGNRGQLCQIKDTPTRGCPLKDYKASLNLILINFYSKVKTFQVCNRKLLTTKW